MLVLLPPSETKVSGGVPGTSLDIHQLSFPGQNRVRESLIEQVVELSRDEMVALRALKLGPKGAPEVHRNRELRTSPAMPALQRYTGVLFDHLDHTSLRATAATWVAESLAVFSALFGLIRATDLIPAYRLSHDSKLTGGSLVSQWAAVAPTLWDEVPGFVLDLRSEGYRKLAPVPSEKGVFIAVVSEGRSGPRKALGHANKASKGLLVRALAESEARLECVEDVISWGSKHGYHFDPESLNRGVLDVVISGS